MISIWVARETSGKVLLRSTIVELAQDKSYGPRLGRCDAKKCYLVPQNGPGSLGPKKSWKTAKLK